MPTDVRTIETAYDLIDRSRFVSHNWKYGYTISRAGLVVAISAVWPLLVLV